MLFYLIVSLILIPPAICDIAVSSDLTKDEKLHLLPKSCLEAYVAGNSDQVIRTVELNLNGTLQIVQCTFYDTGFADVIKGLALPSIDAGSSEQNEFSDVYKQMDEENANRVPKFTLMHTLRKAYSGPEREQLVYRIGNIDPILKHRHVKCAQRLKFDCDGKSTTLAIESALNPKVREIDVSCNQSRYLYGDAITAIKHADDSLFVTVNELECYDSFNSFELRNSFDLDASDACIAFKSATASYENDPTLFTIKGKHSTTTDVTVKDGHVLNVGGLLLNNSITDGKWHRLRLLQHEDKWYFCIDANYFKLTEDSSSLKITAQQILKTGSNYMVFDSGNHRQEIKPPFSDVLDKIQPDSTLTGVDVSRGKMKGYAKEICFSGTGSQNSMNVLQVVLNATARTDNIAFAFQTNQTSAYLATKRFMRSYEDNRLYVAGISLRNNAEVVAAMCYREKKNTTVYCSSCFVVMSSGASTIVDVNFQVGPVASFLRANSKICSFQHTSMRDTNMNTSSLVTRRLLFMSHHHKITNIDSTVQSQTDFILLGGCINGPSDWAIVNWTDHFSPDIFQLQRQFCHNSEYETNTSLFLPNFVGRMFLELSDRFDVTAAIKATRNVMTSGSGKIVKNLDKFDEHLALKYNQVCGQTMNDNACDGKCPEIMETPIVRFGGSKESSEAQHITQRSCYSDAGHDDNNWMTEFGFAFTIDMNETVQDRSWDLFSLSKFDIKLSVSIDQKKSFSVESLKVHNQERKPVEGGNVFLNPMFQVWNFFVFRCDYVICTVQINEHIFILGNQKKFRPSHISRGTQEEKGFEVCFDTADLSSMVGVFVTKPYVVTENLDEKYGRLVPRAKTVPSGRRARSATSTINYLDIPTAGFTYTDADVERTLPHRSAVQTSGNEPRIPIMGFKPASSARVVDGPPKSASGGSAGIIVACFMILLLLLAILLAVFVWRRKPQHAGTYHVDETKKTVYIDSMDGTSRVDVLSDGAYDDFRQPRSSAPVTLMAPESNLPCEMPPGEEVTPRMKEFLVEGNARPDNSVIEHTEPLYEAHRIFNDNRSLSSYGSYQDPSNVNQYYI